MSYSAQSNLDIILYNIRKHILREDVKLEDDRDANNVLKNQYLYPEELIEQVILLLDIKSPEEQLRMEDKTHYQELEFFKSNDVSGDTLSFFKSINKCVSKTGEEYYKHLLSNTITNIPELEERQSILQYFTQYLTPDENNELSTIIQEFKNIEDVLYWNITPKKPEMATILNILFFNQKWSIFLNTKSEFVNLFYYFIIIFTPLWGIFGPIVILFIPYIVSNIFLKVPIPLKFYINQLKNMLFGSQFFIILKMAQHGYNSMVGGGSVDNGWEDNLKNKTINIIMDIITGPIGQMVYFIIVIGGYLWNIYNSLVSSQNYNKLLNFLHHRLNSIRALLDNVKLLFTNTILQRGDNTTLLEKGEFKTLVNECNNLLVNNDYIKFIMNTNTFITTPNILSHKGNIIKGYYLLDANKDTLKPFIRFMGILDTWVSTSKLLNDGFNTTKFISSKTPVINFEGCFSPVLGNKGVCNDCILGGIKDDTCNKQNCLLTGPNGSGKSSYLKTIMSSIICSQTLGIAPINKGGLTPFYHLSTYLNIPDCQGKESLFQAEMSRCYQHLQKCQILEDEGLPSFHIMDEIFVSTNFLEGLSGAYAVVKYLQKYNHSIHIITTHFDKLVDKPLDKYTLQHFTINEEANPDTGNIELIKDYKLRSGKNKKHLALHLLKCKGFDKTLLDDAKNMYQELTEPEEASTAEPEEARTAEPEEAQHAEPEEARTAEPEEAQHAEPEETQQAEPEEAQQAEPEEAQHAEPEDASTNILITNTDLDEAISVINH